MTLAPALVVLVLLFSQDQIWMEQMMDILKRFLPEELLLQAFVYIREETIIHQPLIIFSSITLWTASKSTAHFLMLSKKEHHCSVPNWMIRLLSVWITLEISLILFGMAVLIRLFRIRGMIASEALLLFGLVWFYKRVSLIKTTIKQELPGALMTFCVINGIGCFFFFYINEIALTHSIYGPLSTLVIVLFSCFAVSNAVFLGYTLNEVLKQKRAEKALASLYELLGEKSWKCRSRKQESMEKESDI